MEYCRTSPQPASGTSSILMQTLFFLSKLVHSFLAREIVVDGVGNFELYFGIDRRRLRFSEDEPFFQPITIVLSKVVSFRGIGQMGKLMSQTYRINYASKVQGLSIERIH